LLGLSIVKANQLVGVAARKVFNAAPRNHFIRRWRSETNIMLAYRGGEGVLKTTKTFTGRFGQRLNRRL